MSYYPATQASVLDQFFPDYDADYDADYEEGEGEEFGEDDLDVSPVDLLLLAQLQAAQLAHKRYHEQAAIKQFHQRLATAQRQKAIESKVATHRRIESFADDFREANKPQLQWVRQQMKLRQQQQQPKVLYDIVGVDEAKNLLYLRERNPVEADDLHPIGVSRRSGDWSDRVDPRDPSAVWLTPTEKMILKKKQKMASWVQAISTGAVALAGFAAGGPLGAAIGGAAGNALGEAIAPTPGKRYTAGRALYKSGIAAASSGLAPAIFPGIAGFAAPAAGFISGYATSGK
jgi:hypothetical protein